MLAILRKEIQSFFSTSIGYLVVAIFLLLNGLFLWFFKGEYNILDSGFADASPFFNLAPLILIFLIPAVTMRSFSDEKKQGTLELLVTKPISKLSIVMGKFLGSFFLILIALLPTLLYIYTIFTLGNPQGNLDIGSTMGSYFGLLFLVAAYIAIGIFASTLSTNQIVAFITSVFMCFFFYFGFNGIADLLSSTIATNFGMESHYRSMSRGVLDTRDIIYFLSVTVFFIFLTLVKLQEQKRWFYIALLPIGLFLFNVLTQSFYKRFDLTTDKRYTLNDITKDIIAQAESPIIIDVFLDGDDFPSEIRKLKAETQQLLEEFAIQNSNIIFKFLNPLDNPDTQKQNIESLTRRGLTPMQLSVKENGQATTKVIFPWALASYNDETVAIQLIKNNIGASQSELVSNSVQHLEYAFADGFSKLLNEKENKIAILKGNKELENIQIADFIKTVRPYYYIAPFTLDSIASNPTKTLNELNTYDLIVVAKPTETFTEEDKYVLDQYIMNGGKSLWLLDAVSIDKDSLKTNGKSYALSMDLNLTDFFFKYGVRVNPNLINDLYSEPIVLATGTGSNAQFNEFPWFYAPLSKSENQHSIVKNIDLVRFDFASQLDTLKNSVSKTILLKSSILSRLEGVPLEIDLNMVNNEPDPSLYKNPFVPLAVLLEGKFTSVYKNRIKPFELSETKDESELTKMVVVADGDVIKNEVGRNGPEELGFNKWNGQVYGNKEFLLNTVNYLLDDTGLINIRGKELSIPFLNYEKIAVEKTKWQLVNTLLPLILLALFGITFQYLRKKKYSI